MTMDTNRLRTYLRQVTPAQQTDDRLKLAARVGQLCTVLQAAREGGVELTAGESCLVHSLVDAMTDDLLHGRHHVTLAVVRADNFIVSLRYRLGDE